MFTANRLPTLLALLLVARVVPWAEDCAAADKAPVPARQVGKENPNVRFGMPAPAKADPKSREAFLIERPQYILSYNAKTRTPNWVCWRLWKVDIGKSARAAFEPDPDLPKGVIARVNSRDYTKGGFDRGHMVPAKDRSASPEDSRAVFYMTNIVPQSLASNQRGWERLEDYCRRLAKEGHVLYISCGPQGKGGEGKDGKKDEIGKSRRITVPARLWKVVVVLPGADAEPRKNSRVIAVVMPNDQTVGNDWTMYRTTAREVEKLTGLRFFQNVPDEVAEALRDHRDEVEVRVKERKRKKKGGEE
jgi:endonuclease G